MPFNSNSQPLMTLEPMEQLLGLPELPDQPEEAPRNSLLWLVGQDIHNH